MYRYLKLAAAALSLACSSACSGSNGDVQEQSNLSEGERPLAPNRIYFHFVGFDEEDIDGNKWSDTMSESQAINLWGNFIFSSSDSRVAAFSAKTFFFPPLKLSSSRDIMNDSKEVVSKLQSIAANSYSILDTVYANIFIFADQTKFASTIQEIKSNSVLKTKSEDSISRQCYGFRLPAFQGRNEIAVLFLVDPDGEISGRDQISLSCLNTFFGANAGLDAATIRKWSADLGDGRRWRCDIAALGDKTELPGDDGSSFMCPDAEDHRGEALLRYARLKGVGLDEARAAHLEQAVIEGCRETIIDKTAFFDVEDCKRVLGD